MDGNFTVGLSCGCVYPDTTDGIVCPLHGKSSPLRRVVVGNCVACLGAVATRDGLCPKCKSVIEASTATYLNAEGGGVAIGKFYVHIMSRAWWPQFFADSVDMADVSSTTGKPHETLDVLICRGWTAVFAVITAMDSVHFDTMSRIWAVGVFITQAFLRLPLKMYNVHVVTTLPEFKELTIPKEKGLELFLIHLHATATSSRVLLLPGSVIRRKTALNICSVDNLASALAAAAWEGVPLEEICKETRHAVAYIKRLGSDAIRIGPRVYSARYIVPVPGLSDKLVL